MARKTPSRTDFDRDRRCEDPCDDVRCPQRRVHDAYQQGRWALYSVLYTAESSVRIRTGALWSESQVLDPAICAEIVSTPAVATTATMSARELKAYVEGQRSMIADYMRHPQVWRSDSEIGHHPKKGA